MRGNELLDKLELIDPAYVEAADTKPKKKKNAWVKWGAMAACLCLAVIGTLTMGRLSERQNMPQPSDFSDLEPITIPEQSVGGMGFEGYLFYDISELNNKNPWSENMCITSLPVYQNGAYDPSGAGIPIGLSETEMMQRLDFVVSALGLEVLSIEVIADGFTLIDGEMVLSADPTMICADTAGSEVNIYADGSIAYFLRDGGLALPDEYNFTHSGTTDEEAENVLSYLIDVYDDLLGFAKPKAVSFGDYSFNAEFYRSYMVYDASGDDLEDILNYNFRYVSFWPDAKGNLSGIRINDGLLLAEKLGDYPVITPEEATERLLNGNYQTSVPAKFSGEEYIGKIELVYRTGRLEEVLLPYYRFYVLLPDMSFADNGLKIYGAYYVPAIADEYIVNMPTYDGSFN